MNAGIILAGGKGERLSSDIPKQFIEIEGQPLINYALSVFNECNDIDLICVVVDEKYRAILNGEYVFAEPGISRQHSILNGLCALKAHSPSYVVVHDAARPLVTETDICGCIKGAKGYDGATPGLPVTDTTYQSTDGKTITKALNRDELFAGQTPECYDFKKYLALNESLSDSELSKVRGSSEVAVNYGMQIAICKGNLDNFKITTNTDLERFKSIVRKSETI